MVAVEVQAKLALDEFSSCSKPLQHKRFPSPGQIYAIGKGEDLQ